MSSKVFGGSLIIAGTTIGAGVLAVPVLTASIGLIPATVLYALAWAFSVASALGYLEVMTWFKGHKNINMISMVDHTLGKVGKVSMWLVYMFLFYSLMIAYFCDGGSLVVRALGLQNIHWMRNVAPIIFAVLCCPLVLFGTKVLDYANRFLVIGLIAAFGVFCFLGLFNLHPELLTRSSWQESLSALPIMFLAFGFQNVIPSIYYYMDGKAQNVKRAIFLGSVIPLVLYIIWEALVLGAVPVDFLLEAKANGYTAAESLKRALQCPAFYVAGEFFGLFALVSSFIGVGMGLMDFFIDAFHWDKKKQGFTIFMLTFFIPMIWATINPTIALTCLKYAGGIGEATLIGAFPVFMLWKGRYHSKHVSRRLIPGGKLVLLLMLFAVFVNIIVLFREF